MDVNRLDRLRNRLNGLQATLADIIEHEINEGQPHGHELPRLRRAGDLDDQGGDRGADPARRDGGEVGGRGALPGGELELAAAGGVPGGELPGAGVGGPPGDLPAGPSVEALHCAIREHRAHKTPSDWSPADVDLYTHLPEHGGEPVTASTRQRERLTGRAAT